MMRGAELPLNDERAVIQHCGDAEYLGGLQRLVEAQRRKYSGDALGQHCLAGPGRTDHENVMYRITTPANRCRSLTSKASDLFGMPILLCIQRSEILLLKL